jgi:hypothetical protein
MVKKINDEDEDDEDEKEDDDEKDRDKDEDADDEGAGWSSAPGPDLSPAVPPADVSNPTPSKRRIAKRFRGLQATVWLLIFAI